MTEELIEQFRGKPVALASYFYVLGTMDGYVFAKELENHDNLNTAVENHKNITTGVLNSNSFRNSIPDNFENHSEDLAGIVNCGIDYVDRWRMYRDLFKNEKYAC